MHSGVTSVKRGESHERFMHSGMWELIGAVGQISGMWGRGVGGRELEELVAEPHLPLEGGVRARWRRGRVEIGLWAGGREWQSLWCVAAAHAQRWGK